MSDKAKQVSKSIALFVAAGVCEIGGGWLVWKWRKDDWHWGYFLLGSAILIAYGIIPTLQDQVFGRVYAAYGGFFILLSFCWAWAFDGERPDRWDLIGSAIAIAGVSLIMSIREYHALLIRGLRLHRISGHSYVGPGMLFSTNCYYCRVFTSSDGTVNGVSHFIEAVCILASIAMVQGASFAIFHVQLLPTSRLPSDSGTPKT